jgi:hypothetical protein
VAVKNVAAIESDFLANILWVNLAVPHSPMSDTKMTEALREVVISNWIARNNE